MRLGRVTWRLSMVASLVLTVPAAALLPARAGTFVSDTFSGDRLGQFSYHGRWEHVRNVRDGRFFGSSSRTAASGASVRFSFVGRVVRVYGVRGPGGGYGSVKLDGTSYPNIDFYSSVKTPRRLVFSTPLLPAGKHSLTIATVEGFQAPLHRRGYLNITGAAYE